MLRRAKCRHHLLSRHHYLCPAATFSTGTGTGTSDLATLISDLVITHTGDAASLTRRLTAAHPTPWPPTLPDLVLKRLWDDGPRALLFFSALPSPPPPSTLTHALDIAARLRSPRALRLLLSLHRPLSPRAFAVLAERYALSARPDRAVRLFLSLPRPQPPASFNTLLSILCKARHVRKASSLLRALRGRFPPDAVTYNILADGWCRLHRTSHALSVLRDMVDDGVDPTPATYNTLLNGFFKAGQITQGMQFFSQMRERAHCRPDVVSYTTVIHGLGTAGRLDDARNVFDEMVRGGCVPNIATYNALIQVNCKKGCVEDGMRVFDEMVREGGKPNSVTYNLLIRGLCHRGEMERAMEFKERMRSEGCGPNVQTYNVLIRCWCEEGEIEKGLEILGRMVEPGGCLPNKDTYNVLISSMFVRKRPEDMVTAGKMVMDMVQRGHLPRKFMFNRVLNGLLVTGNQGFAKELLRMQDRCGRLHRNIRL